MRFLFWCVSVCGAPLMAMTTALAQTPDAAPSTPVDMVEMLAFEPTREEAVLEAYIDGVVGAHMRAHHTSGVTVSVVQNGKVLFSKGYGFADIETQTPVNGYETLFRIGSVSKTFVWASVLMLAEQGRLDLNADVNNYLKGITIAQPFGLPVTMNHLMAHRAGFEDSIGVYTYSDDSGVTLTEALNDDMPKQVYPPGARTSYSNWGAALAAKIVEDVSGVPYEVFLQNEILTPLAMTRTTLKGPSIMVKGLRDSLAVGYIFENGALEPESYSQIGPYASVGAMAAPASDMAQWMLLLLGRGEHDGVRLYSKQTAALMQARAFNDRPDGGDIAHGFFTNTYRGYDVFGHGGATASFYTYMQLVPSLNLGIFISQSSSDDRTLISTLPDLIIDYLAAGDRGIGAVAVGVDASERSDDYAGNYISNRRSFSQFEKLFSADATAEVTSGVAGGEAGALVLSRSDKDQQLLPVAGVVDVFQDRYGKRIMFGRDGNGKVTHFSGDTYSYERMEAFSNPLYLNIGFLAVALFAVTTWLGAWRRWGAVALQTATGKALGVFDLVAAASIFVFFALLVSVITISGDTDALLKNYPPSQIQLMRMFAAFVFFLGSAALVSLIPAWLKSGWSIWRKAHHTLFALSLGFLAVMLVAWNVVVAATA